MTKKEFLRLKPSKLLRVALADLRAVEKDSRYEVKMTIWHCPDRLYCLTDTPKRKCLVCLGGSALAKTLKFSPEVAVEFEKLGQKLESRMLALDHFRVGLVLPALEKLGIKDSRGMKNRTRIDYSLDPIKFKRAMARLARDLEKKNF